MPRSRRVPRGQVPDLAPRKLPRQERARAGVDAILEATAHLLREDGYAALTTNHIASRAGVSIGTLYQFFPGKEAVVAALAERIVRRQLEGVVGELPGVLAEKTPAAGLERLVRRIVRSLSADRRLHAALLRDVPFLRELPIVRDAVEEIIAVARDRLEPLRGETAIEDLTTETWLIGRMAYESIVAVAVFREGPADLDRTVSALVRLLLRMVGARDARGKPRRNDPRRR